MNSKDLAEEEKPTSNFLSYEACKQLPNAFFQQYTSTICTFETESSTFHDSLQNICENLRKKSSAFYEKNTSDA